MWVGEEGLASIFPGQGNDVMMEHIEGETLPKVLLEVPLEEIISSLEEIPSMVELDAPQLREIVPLILGAEDIVDTGRREDESHASNQLVVPARDECQCGRVENRHGVGKEEVGRRAWDFEPQRCVCVCSLRCRARWI